MRAGTGKATPEGKAWACLMTNVLVLPGLGTMAAGRRTTGLVQAIVALFGFVFVCVWLVSFVMDAVRASGLPEDLGAHANLGLFGLFLAIGSWVWGLLSGLAILREARPSSPTGR